MTDEEHERPMAQRHVATEPKVQRAHGGLPVPRLEVAWRPLSPEEQRDGYTWQADYRLIVGHFLGHEMEIRLGLTLADPHGGWIEPRRLPFRDGAHARHDCWRLKLPLFVVTPSGAIQVDGPRDDDDESEEG